MTEGTLFVPYIGASLLSGEFGVVVEDAYSVGGLLCLFLSRVDFEQAVALGKETLRDPLVYARRCERFCDVDAARRKLGELAGAEGEVSLPTS